MSCGGSTMFVTSIPLQYATHKSLVGFFDITYSVTLFPKKNPTTEQVVHCNVTLLFILSDNICCATQIHQNMLYVAFIWVQLSQGIMPSSL